MSDSRQQHRRRRPPALEGEETAPRTHRIVASDADTPEWMVSAERTSGAAERRGTPGTRTGAQDGAKREPRANADRRSQESMAILAMKKKAAAPAAPVAPVAPAAPAAPAASAAQDEPAALEANAKPEATTAPRAMAAGERKPRTKTTGGVRAPYRPDRPAKAPAKKSAPRKLSKKARARRNAQIRQTVILTAVAAVVIALVIGGVVGGSRLLDIKRTLDRGDGVFYPNIFVNDIPLQGMTLDQAASVVTQQVENLVSAWRITLRTQDGRSWNITGQDLKMQYDVADQLDQLWAIGHTGSSAVRYEQVTALDEEPVIRHTTLTYDLSGVNQILSQIKSEVDVAPISATRVEDNSKWPPFSYTDDVAGVQLDITGLNEKIIGMVERLESGVVDLTPTPVQAPVTRAYLESQIVELASYDTAIGATSDPGRFINIEVGTKKFDKLIIKSGELVSFNKIAGERKYSNGYADAPELAYGDYRMGVGGGICQVSSTLYNAVVNAGLEIKTRYQHSLPSNYVPLGLDATVQDNRLDFVFKNNTNADIYISTEYYKKKNYWHCKFTIHGRPDPDGHSYKLESVVKEELAVPAPTYIPDTKAEYVVYDDEMFEYSKGDEGYVVDVYLVTSDAKGLEVSRELQYTDTYKAKQPKYYVGVTPRETPVPELMPID